MSTSGITASIARTCLDIRVLELIIMPTEACNFRCVYCYQEFKHKSMAPDIVRGVMNLLSRRAPELDYLHLSWFGGEPLLAKHVIKKILVHAAVLRRANPGMKFFSDMTTNGFLLSRDLFEHLLALGVTQYQITLDGPRERHNEKRVLAGGGGTFDRLWQNLVALRDVRGEFTILVRLHMDKENLETLPAFIQEYGDAFGQDTRFKLFFRQLSRMGGPNDDRLPILDDHDREEAARLLSGYAKQRGVAYMTTDNVAPICYAARGNSYIVRSDGRLSKCTLALQSQSNYVGRVLESGQLELEVPKLRMWMRGLQSGETSELECPMHGYPASEAR